jgi:hypothetical protein
MTARKPPTNYGQLAARFGTVRRAWKRAAALSGLAIVATESIGILTALLFLDWLYQPLPLIRIAMWTAAVACIGYFLARHVLKPLLRKIPDEQIALYMEENRRELDGVLITAVEYGRKRNNVSGNQAALIDEVINQAADRSGRTPVGHIVDFARLKKYGLGAVIGIGLYAVLGVLFPNTFGYHIGRVLQPWHATSEDLAKHQAAEEMAAPLRFSLSKGNTSLPRGSSFDFEVTLSKPKPTETPVQVNFRSKAGGAEWQHLPMTEIEKLNGFEGAIPDVSEDMEFYVSCGADKSDTFQLSVYDPLVVQSMEMKVHYPDYIKQADEIQRPFAGDLTAVVGSTATLRILTSTPLKEGQIKWSNGQTQSVTIDPQANSTASVSFEVKQSDTYDYTLTDINGQQATSAAPLSVQAIPDTPPTIQIKSPQSPVLTQPVGEIDFQAEAGDDFGVAGVDLVYALLDEKGEAHETRVPLKLDPGDNKDVPHAVEASYQLMLEDHVPPFQPDDAISYHLEARDGKGQTTSSEIGFILVGYYEHWSTWGGKEAFSLHQAGADLMSLLHLTWQLDSKKSQLQPADFQKQAQDIASQLVGPDGTVVDFLHLAKFPQLARVKDVVNAHIKKAHDSLLATDTTTAITDLSTAVALVAGGQLKQDSVSHLDDQVMIGSTSGPPAFTMLELTRIKALDAANKDKTHQEGTEADAKRAADMAKKVEELRKNQEDLLAKASALAPAAGKKPMAGGGGAETSAGKQPNPDLAKAQHDLADKTRAAAQAAKQGQGTGGADNAKIQDAAAKTNQAANLMEEASRAFLAGKNDEGQAKANEAKLTLQAAGEVLHNTDRDKLEASISDAARHAAVLLEKQQDLSAETATLATDMGTNKPDQRQQRDLQVQAYQETVLGANADALGAEINDLNQLATQIGEPESVRALAEAQRIIKRTPPQAKMSDAVIDINNATPALASPEQKDAEAALAKIVESLQAGSDSLAANAAAELSRASRAANDAKNGIAALQAKGGAQGKGDQAKGGAQAQGNQAQAGAQGQGNQAQGAQANGNQAQGGSQGAAGQTPADAQGNASGGGDDVRQVAYNINQLATIIDGRLLVPQDEVDRLKEMSMDKSELEKRLAVDPKFLQDASDLVGSISNKIEAEIQAKAEAGKLFSSQREECPPKYRQLVNKYFEALSQLAPAPAQGSAPATTGQP